MVPVERSQPLTKRHGDIFNEITICTTVEASKLTHTIQWLECGDLQWVTKRDIADYQQQPRVLHTTQDHPHRTYDLKDMTQYEYSC